MNPLAVLDRRPVIVAVAGPNGAGKSTFFHAHLAGAGLRFVNADVLARELALDAPRAMAAAAALRQALLGLGESFVFETVFSDPVGDKIGFLAGAAAKGYTVVVCFIGLDSAEQSIERVAMRTAQGGHDVPDDKLQSRYPRTLHNLRRAIHEVPYVLVFDNADLHRPFRLVASYVRGAETFRADSCPAWLPE